MLDGATARMCGLDRASCATSASQGARVGARRHRWPSGPSSVSTGEAERCVGVGVERGRKRVVVYVLSGEDKRGAGGKVEDKKKSRQEANVKTAPTLTLITPN